MNRSSLISLLITLLLIIASDIRAQKRLDEKISERLQNWNTLFPQERIYLQTDRSQYMTGETIWLKTWCTLDGQPSFLSQIVYIILTDKDGQVIQKRMYTIKNQGSVGGMLDLPTDLKSGLYTVSAFTLWMLNFPQTVAHKKILVYNSSKVSSLRSANAKATILFFPEGGQLVEGVHSKIAFKAVNGNGIPVPVKGSILKPNGEKLLDFQASNDGIGIIEMTPEPNTIYKAKVQFDNYRWEEIYLPKPQKRGLVLSVNNSSVSKLFIMAAQGLQDPLSYKKVLVFAHMQGIPVFWATFDFDAGETAAAIPKKNLPPGVLQIVVFDTAGSVLAERLAFIHQPKAIEPQVSFTQISKNQRGENRLSFRLDSVERPDLSVLVVDKEYSKLADTQPSVLASHFLCQYVNEYIHNPDRYFNQQPETQSQLDALMMTLTWKPFTWKQLLQQDSMALKYPVESYLAIKGKATRPDNQQPIKTGFVTLLVKGEDSTSVLAQAQLTDKGEFIVDSLQFHSKATVFYQGTSQTKSLLPVDVTIYPAFIDTIKKTPWQVSVNLDTSGVDDPFQNYANAWQAKSNSDGRLLETVTVRTKKLSPLDSIQKQYVSPMFEISDQTITLAEGRNYVNIWQFLNASVPGFNVNPFQPGGVTNVSFTRHQGASLSEEDADNRYIKFFLNEVPISTDVIDALNPGDVALVKVYKGATAFPFGADAGAISIYTKKGALVNSAVYDKTFLKMEKLGFATSREHKSPDYTKYPELNKGEIDNRLILYWNSDLKPLKNGLYEIRFHNNDLPKGSTIIIQGIDNNGKLIFKQFSIPE